jgi:hypothetical protein
VAITLTRDEVLSKITEYVRREFLGETEGEDGSDLEPTTPLLQLGILTSANTGRLLAYILEEFGLAVPPTRITGKHFQDLDSIAALVSDLLDA